MPAKALSAAVRGAGIYWDLARCAIGRCIISGFRFTIHGTKRVEIRGIPSIIYGTALQAAAFLADQAWVFRLPRRPEADANRHGSADASPRATAVKPRAGTFLLRRQPPPTPLRRARRDFRSGAPRRPPKRNSATASRARGRLSPRRTGLASTGAKRLYSGADDEQGLAGDRLRPESRGWLGALPAKASAARARTAATSDGRARSGIASRSGPSADARTPEGSRSSAQAVNRAAPRLASGSRRSRTLSGKSLHRPAVRAPRAGRRG